jgi:hypothetical protein
VELIKLIQSMPALVNTLDDLGNRWQCCALIHGDLRWDNCIVQRELHGAVATLRLVDWEFSGIGDPHWDVATALAEFLGFWLLSIPVIGNVAFDRLIEDAPFRLEQMHPAMGAVWRSYTRAGGFADGDMAEHAHLTTRYAALHLLEMACEQTHYASDVTPQALCLLQVLINILAYPRSAAGQLLGIPVTMP